MCLNWREAVCGGYDVKLIKQWSSTDDIVVTFNGDLPWPAARRGVHAMDDVRTNAYCITVDFTLSAT